MKFVIIKERDVQRVLNVLREESCKSANKKEGKELFHVLADFMLPKVKQSRWLKLEEPFMGPFILHHLVRSLS